jgi:hypothetical protein
MIIPGAGPNCQSLKNHIRQQAVAEWLVVGHEPAACLSPYRFQNDVSRNLAALTRLACPSRAKVTDGRPTIGKDVGSTGIERTGPGRRDLIGVPSHLKVYGSVTEQMIPIPWINDVYSSQAGWRCWFSTSHIGSMPRRFQTAKCAWRVPRKLSSACGWGLSSIVGLWFGMNQHSEQLWSLLFEADLKLGDDVVDARQG